MSRVKSSTSILTYSGLSDWLRAWEATLEEPNDLLFAPSLPNLFSLILADPRIQTKAKIDKSNKGWERKLLGLLESALEAQPNVVSLLKHEHPMELAQLKRLLSQASYDVPAIVATLKPLASAPSINRLRHQLMQTLSRPSRTSYRKLSTISYLLQRKVIEKYDVSELKVVLKKQITKIGAAIILPKHLDMLSNDASLNAALQFIWSDTFVKELTPSNVSRLINPSADSVLAVVGNFAWTIRTTELLDQSAVELAHILGTYTAASNPDASSFDELLGNNDQLEALGVLLVRTYVQNLLQQTLEMVGHREREDPDSAISELTRTIVALLASKAGIRPLHRWESETDLSLQEELSSLLEDLYGRVLEYVTCQQVAKFVAEHVYTGALTDIGFRVARSVVEHLKSTLANEYRDLTQYDLPRLTRITRELFANRGTQHLLVELLTHANDSIRRWLQTRAARYLLRSLSPDPRQFWTAWIDALPEWTTLYESFFDYLPWATFTSREADGLFSTFLNNLDVASDEWLVIFKVHNLDPKGRIWSLANVVLYDPSAYDFGEDLYVGPRSASSATAKNEPITFAKVSIRAETPTAARYHAWVNLNAALNTLSYATAVDVKAGGLKPEIDIESAVCPLGTARWSSQWQRTRAELFERNYAATEQIVQFSKTYSHLVELENSNRQQMNEVQLKFMQALPWYIKGRWEPNATERFLFYWIATEHLFAQGRAKRELFDTLPKLAITWRDIPDLKIPLTFLSREWRSLVQYIAEDPNMRTRIDANLDLAHWQSDHRVLMRSNNLAILARLTRYAQPDRREIISRFVGEVRRLHRRRAMLMRETQAVRDDYDFRLHMLYELRNQMVHDALAYRPAMQLYASELENVIQNILKKLSDVAVDQNPAYTTLDQLIDAYQEPFT